MKIIIIDTVYDTEDIFYISEIRSHFGRYVEEYFLINPSEITHEFVINFYNGTHRRVSIEARPDDLSNKVQEIAGIGKEDFYKKYGDVDTNTFIRGFSLNEYEKIKKLYDGIFEIWSKNQSTLPKFVFE